MSEVVDLTRCVLAGCDAGSHRCENPTQKAGGDDEAGGKGGLPVRPDAEPSTGEPASEPPAAPTGGGGRDLSAPSAAYEAHRRVEHPYLDELAAPRVLPR